MGGFSCGLEILACYQGFTIVSWLDAVLFSLDWQSPRDGVSIKVLVCGNLKRQPYKKL